jgi:DNA processing protein
LRQGAALVESAADVLAVLNEAPGVPLLEPEPFDFVHRPAEMPNPTKVGTARAAVQECLGPAPLVVDEIIRSCHMSPSVVSLVLLELELAGRLERHPGNRVSLIAER